MTSGQPEVPYRRIGSILVERGLITEDELRLALDEQDRSGRLLGEILVSSFGVTRVDLADALAEQWQEANRASGGGSPADVAPTNGDGPHEGSEQISEDDLRVLLDEAEAARAELEVRTEELSRRLATLEGVVSEVTQALDELRAVTRPGNGNGTDGGNGSRGEAPPPVQYTRPRSRRRR